MDPEDQTTAPVDETEEWKDWHTKARAKEPIFVEALDHHEIDLGYPGVEIIKSTEPFLA